MGNCIQKSSSISSKELINTVTVRNDADDNIRDDTIEVDERKKKQQIEPPAVTPSSASSSSLSPSSNDKENSTTPNNNKNNNNNNIEITERTIPSSIENDDFQIPIKIFHQPLSSSATKKPKPPRATVFFIHGGIFVQGDRNSHSTISKALASQLNLIVVTATFRNGKDAPHRTNITMRDLHDVVDFVTKKEWPHLPFGLVGSSSGGYFALQLSTTLGPLGGVQFCIPICPVADPFKRASYLRSSIRGSARSDGYNSFHDPDKSQEILEKQLSYWESDSSMKEAGRSISKRNLFDGSSNNKKEKDTDNNNSRNHNVPTLLIIGSADKNVPFDVTADVQSWATRTIVVGGKGHELCDKIVEGGGYHCYLSDIDRFIEYCLSLE